MQNRKTERRKIHTVVKIQFRASEILKGQVECELTIQRKDNNKISEAGNKTGTSTMGNFRLLEGNQLLVCSHRRSLGRIWEGNAANLHLVRAKRCNSSELQSQRGLPVKKNILDDSSFSPSAALFFGGELKKIKQFYWWRTKKLEHRGLH